MESEIAKLYENLSLADEDVAIHEMPEEVHRDGVANVDRCLVGKVLSGKKVNIEAFKGLIEQLWNQFGAVEIESLGHNIFITAKWLAEQLGEVIEIPMEAKDCWGKFMRVKVLIEISKPLKRWLRLKLDKSDNIVLVGLKYERLPQFCYACGIIGHVIKDCLDTEAKTAALSGSTTRFGSWMRAPVVDRRKFRGPSKSDGSSLRDVAISDAVSRKGIVGASLETLIPSVGPGSNLGKELCEVGLSESNVSDKVQMATVEQGGLSICMVGGVEPADSVILDTPMIQSEMLEVISSPKMRSSKKMEKVNEGRTSLAYCGRGRCG
ncbi:hypothetical protein EZV62_011067 [Acer yangbiense]|uniref:CCHC-type domain-containing protein n=1 Tax=Acer yangbiense TaxID=1000413 RepID=A0A5C7I3H2_9ROSI|nr:hypothetical protein EZV62_011067 [Acer yangbiense]